MKSVTDVNDIPIIFLSMMHRSDKKTIYGEVLMKEGRVKRIVSSIILVVICFLACSALAADHGSFMIVPINCNKNTGDAVASDVLAGKTFSNQYAVGIPGTMPNVGKQVITPTTSNQSITKGYHDGSGMVVGDADLKNIYILTGVWSFSRHHN